MSLKEVPVQRRECCYCGEDIKEDEPTVVHRDRTLPPEFWDEAHEHCEEKDTMPEAAKRMTPYWRLPLG